MHMFNREEPCFSLGFEVGIPLDNDLYIEQLLVWSPSVATVLENTILVPCTSVGL